MTPTEWYLSMLPPAQPIVAKVASIPHRYRPGLCSPGYGQAADNADAIAPAVRAAVFGYLLLLVGVQLH